ncbi:MAG: DeoR/GlpR family DNA-binding transcription regulator [Microbacterium sp.]
MYPAERQAKIIALARDSGGTLGLAEARSALGVTAETVRRDFNELEQKGHVTRRRGGISLLTTAPLELALAQRRMQDTPQKLRIARAVTEMLPRQGTLFLDSGSVALFVASMIPLDSELVVITNNLPAALLLLEHPAVSVLTLPGRVRSITQAVVDAEVGGIIGDLAVDLAVLGSNGLTIENGLSTTTPEEADVKRAIIRASRRRIVAVTARTVGFDAMCAVAPLSEVHTVVTERKIGERALREISDAGPEVVAT